MSYKSLLWALPLMGIFGCGAKNTPETHTITKTIYGTRTSYEDNRAGRHQGYRDCGDNGTLDIFWPNLDSILPGYAVTRRIVIVGRHFECAEHNNIQPEDEIVFRGSSEADSLQAKFDSVVGAYKRQRMPENVQ